MIMSKSKKELLVPFSLDGKTQYTHENWNNVAILENNKPFYSVLRYEGFERGRSRLNIKWLDVVKDRTYFSSMAFLDNILKSKSNLEDRTLRNSLVIKGNFHFKKHGTAILLTEYKPKQ